MAARHLPLDRFADLGRQVPVGHRSFSHRNTVRLRRRNMARRPIGNPPSLAIRRIPFRMTSLFRFVNPDERIAACAEWDTGEGPRRGAVDMSSANIRDGLRWRVDVADERHRIVHREVTETLDRILGPDDSLEGTWGNRPFAFVGFVDRSLVP